MLIKCRILLIAPSSNVSSLYVKYNTWKLSLCRNWENRVDESLDVISREAMQKRKKDLNNHIFFSNHTSCRYMSINSNCKIERSFKKVFVFHVNFAEFADCSIKGCFLMLFKQFLLPKILSIPESCCKTKATLKMGAISQNLKVFLQLELFLLNYEIAFGHQ